MSVAEVRVPTAQNDLMRTLYDEHAGALWGYVMRLTGGDRAGSEDVVQETLLRAWRHPGVLDQSEGSARAWLFTVARRIVIDQWRSRRARPEVTTDVVPERPVGDGTDQALQTWMVTDALRRLSQAHRQVLLACFYQGHSVAEVAESLGIPEGTVKSRTHYALRALRLALQEMGVSE